MELRKLLGRSQEAAGGGGAFGFRFGLHRLFLFFLVGFSIFLALGFISFIYFFLSVLWGLPWPTCWFVFFCCFLFWGEGFHWLVFLFLCCPSFLVSLSFTYYDILCKPSRGVFFFF